MADPPPVFRPPRWCGPWPAGPTLVLRPWVPADAPVLAAAWADPEVARWNPVPDERGPAAARRWIDGGAARRRAGVLDLAVVTRAGGAVVGEVGLVAVGPERRFGELGWWTAGAWRRRGHAATAVALIVAWALAGPPGHRVERAFARLDPANVASQATARRAGLAPLGTAGGVQVWATPGRQDPTASLPP